MAVARVANHTLVADETNKAVVKRPAAAVEPKVEASHVEGSAADKVVSEARTRRSYANSRSMPTSRVQV